MWIRYALRSTVEGRWLFCPEFPDSDFRIAWTDEGKATQPTTFLTWEKTVSFSINGTPASILRITQITRFWLYPPKGVRHTRKCSVFTRLSGLRVIRALPTSRNASPATLSTFHLLCRAAVQIGGPSYLCPSGIFCLSTQVPPLQYILATIWFLLQVLALWFSLPWMVFPHIFTWHAISLFFPLSL